MTPLELKLVWEDKPEFHKYIHETFIEKVNADADLNAHRTFVENHVFGMGERSFHWFWKIMVDEMPDGFNFLEIGVHKAQVLSLIKLLADRTNKSAVVFGVTPLNGAETGWTEDNYLADIERIHKEFNLLLPTIFKGLSQSPDILESVYNESPYDIVYVDGSHTYEGALFDLNNYSKMIKPGGYLVVDDAACHMNMPFGYFQGIDTVCHALQDWELNDLDNNFEFQFNVVHLVVYKRKA